MTAKPEKINHPAHYGGELEEEKSMTRNDFKNLYKQSLFEACEKWPDNFRIDWRTKNDAQLDIWLGRALEAISKNEIVMTGSRSGFKILCEKLGIKQTVKNIQAALASCDDA